MEQHDTQMTAEELRNIPLFASLSEEMLLDQIPYFTLVVLPKDEILFHEGEESDALYMVLQGRLRVFTSHKDGHESTLGVIGEGETVGEIQVLTGGKRTASVSAYCETRLFKMSKGTFHDLITNVPELLPGINQVILRRLRRNRLKSILLDLFAIHDAAMFSELEAHLEWKHLQQGELLFRQGDVGDSVCILVSGMLQVVLSEKDGSEKIVNEIERGETVGEMSLLTGECRSANVYAMRESDVVTLSKEAFEHISRRYPEFRSTISTRIITRLRKTLQAPPTVHHSINFAFVSLSPDVLLEDFTTRLCQAFSRIGSTLLLNSKRVNSLLGMSDIAQTLHDSPYSLMLSAWLEEQEVSYQYILYECDPTVTSWNRRSIKNADHIVLVARAEAAPSLNVQEQDLLPSSDTTLSSRRTLILIHPGGNTLPTGTKRWLHARTVERHHHLRWNSQADFERLARLLSGKAIGVVLGGGAARGFAEIGILRALEEAGIPIDIVGGTSMGALNSALYAMGCQHKEIIARQRMACSKLISAQYMLRYLTLPIMSFAKPCLFEKMYTRMVGEIAIEDLWLNFFCISSNLSTSAMMVHTKGSLKKALLASSAVPGLLVPVIDENNLLVDGGFINNVPGDVMRQWTQGPVIVVNVTVKQDFKVYRKRFPSPWTVLAKQIVPFLQPVTIPKIWNIWMKLSTLTSNHQANLIAKQADVYFQPPLEQFGLFEFERIDEIVETGYHYAMQEIQKQQLSLARLYEMMK